MDGRLLSAMIPIGAITIFAAGPVSAFSEAELYQPFDASTVTWEERRYVQAALALRGYYNGMLDGDWGPGSVRALSAYTIDTIQELVAPNWLVSILTDEFSAFVAQDRWEMIWFEDLGLSAFLPTGQLSKPFTSNGITSIDHLQSSLRFSVTYDDSYGLAAFHAGMMAEALNRPEPYTLRRDNLWITAVTHADGVRFYLRSQWTGRDWGSFVLSAGDADRDLLDLVASSLTRGQADDLHLPYDGELVRGGQAVDRILAAHDRDVAPVKPSETAPAATSRTQAGRENAAPAQSSGTGFYVSADGAILTNEHVISACRSIRVNGADVQVIATDQTFDLALLGSDARLDVYATFATRSAGLNSDITVAGYPLHGLLSGLNVTRGAVTSVRGIGGDSTRMQISAPVQPGNSGGPVMNQSGEVVGVVVSKLDAGLVLEATGDIPQNINFAIRGEMAQFFLVQNGQMPVLSETGVSLSGEELAAFAERITVLIECDE